PKPLIPIFTAMKIASSCLRFEPLCSYRPVLVYYLSSSECIILFQNKSVNAKNIRFFLFLPDKSSCETPGRCITILFDCRKQPVGYPESDPVIPGSDPI